jgi:hypothetical protein
MLKSDNAALLAPQADIARIDAESHSRRDIGRTFSSASFIRNAHALWIKNKPLIDKVIYLSSSVTEWRKRLSAGTIMV